MTERPSYTQVQRHRRQCHRSEAHSSVGRRISLPGVLIGGHVLYYRADAAAEEEVVSRIDQFVDHLPRVDAVIVVRLRLVGPRGEVADRRSALSELFEDDRLVVGVLRGRRASRQVGGNIARTEMPGLRIHVDDGAAHIRQGDVALEVGSCLAVVPVVGAAARDVHEALFAGRNHVVGIEGADVGRGGGVPVIDRVARNVVWVARLVGALPGEDGRIILVLDAAVGVGPADEHSDILLVVRLAGCVRVEVIDVRVAAALDLLDIPGHASEIGPVVL